MQTNINNVSPMVAYYCDASYTGGAEKYLYYLAKYIPHDRFRPYLIFDEDSSAEKFISQLVREEMQFIKLSKNKHSFTGKYGRIISFFRQLKPDILHINLPGPFDASYSLVASLARLAGVKHIVSTEHLPMIPSFTKSRLMKGFNTKWIDRIITVSKDNTGHLVQNHRIPERKIKVVYNGIPGTLGKDGKDEDSLNSVDEGRFHLVIAGSLERRKGQTDAVKLMVELPDLVDLYIVGEGELEDELKKLVFSLELTDRVHFTGYREDMPEFLNGMDVMILPTRVDATPYVIIEAMSVGLPVIASGIYGIPELIDDKKSGILIKPGDIHGFAEAVRVLFKNRELYRDMSIKARERFKKKFTIEECIRNTIGVYNDLLRNKRNLRGKMD